LQRKNRELESVRKDQRTEPKRLPAAVPAPLERPTPELSTLAPLSAGEVVLADDLANHYKADPRGADARYKNKVFRVEGVVDDFNYEFFIRKYSVVLATADRAMRLLCHFSYPDEYKSVFSRHDGQELAATLSRGEKVLMKRYESIVIKGRCAGNRNSTIHFTECERIR